MQFDRVSGLVEDAVRSGATVAAGGSPINKDGGYYFQPTILSNVTEGMRIVDEEQFGPVLPVLKYSDVNDAVARANNTTYGLGSSVWGSNADEAAEVGLRLEAGMTWINTHLASVEQAPFGGIKASGVGREGGGQIGLKEFVDMKTVIRSK